MQAPLLSSATNLSENLSATKDQDLSLAYPQVQMMEPNTAARLDRERRRRRGDRGENVSRWKREQQTHTRKEDFRRPKTQRLWSVIDALIHICMLQSRTCNNQASPRHPAQSVPRRFAAAHATCAECVMARPDQTEPGQVVIKHAIDHALPLC